jgi:hypothetical protein
VVTTKGDKAMKKTLLTLSILAALATLTACGGGGSSNPSSGSTKKTVTGVVSARTVAPRAAFAAAAGSNTVTVNGTTYTLDATATVNSDDSSSTLGSIAEGDVVTVEASDEDGDGVWTATAVEYDDELQGFVLANTLVADGAGGFTGTLNVMGMEVKVDAATVYEQGDGTRATIDLLAAGDVVEVSGFPDATGTITATRIEGKDPAEDIEVKGVISNLDAGAMTFTLGTLIVDYSAADTGDLSGGPSDGLYVEVKAAEDILALTDNGDGTYTLAASQVELQDGGDAAGGLAAEGDSMEVAGVLAVDGSGVITLDGYTLVVNASSNISEGQLAALAGQLVEVEGYVENGNLVVVDAAVAN